MKKEIENCKINYAHSALGYRFDNWMKMKRDNPITKKKQARMTTAVTFLLGIPALAEWVIFNGPIKRTKLEKGPVFIVGFWRSGTTFLQNLLTRDPQFGWFDPVSTVTFSNCILLRPILAKVQKNLLKEARPFDNMDYELNLPMEEVFAQATITDCTVSHMLIFPDGGKGVRYIDRAFVDEQSEDYIKAWRKSYDYILKKVAYINKGKQLLLKSPENTCRIGELKRCYPNSKYIDIYRDPYKTIMSTINMFSKEMELLRLNKPAPREMIEEVAIDLFARVYKKAIAEMAEMKEEDCIHIKYEDFCKDKENYLKKIYQQLQLDGYEEAKPYFDAYLESQKNYQKNKFTLDPVLRDKINAKLGFYFEHYGYEMIQE